MYTFAQWVVTPANRSAFEAVRRVAARVGTVQRRRTDHPLFLHGPSGTGKTHLASALAAEVVGRCPGLVVTHLPARTLGEALLAAADADRKAARDCDLLIVED